MSRALRRLILWNDPQVDGAGPLALRTGSDPGGDRLQVCLIEVEGMSTPGAEVNALPVLLGIGRRLRRILHNAASNKAVPLSGISDSSRIPIVSGPDHLHLGQVISPVAPPLHPVSLRSIGSQYRGHTWALLHSARLSASRKSPTPVKRFRGLGGTHGHRSRFAAPLLQHASSDNPQILTEGRRSQVFGNEFQTDFHLSDPVLVTSIAAEGNLSINRSSGT
jgi:hypothetical protein